MKQLIYILSLSTLIAACNHSAQHSDDVHTHEAKLQITAYSNNMELFAESDPFSVGQNAEILAHFSWLENFKPLKSGNITASLIIDNKSIKQTLKQPLRAGIYKFQLQPQVAGIGKIVFDINSEEGKSQIIVNNITVYNNKHDAEHAAEANAVSETNATVFTKEQSWKVDFATDHPIIEPFGPIIKTSAQVGSAQSDEILISAKTNGIVMLSADDLVEGKNVTADQILFSISGSGLANNNSSTQYAKAKNNYEKAKTDYERLKELANDKIISEKDLLHAKNLYENAKVAYENLNKNFNASGQKVSSPMDGYIKQVFVQKGQYVEAGQPIVSISQNKSLLLKAEVQQKYASVLGTIKSANIRTLHNDQTYSLEQLNGKFLSFGRNTTEDNYLIPISLSIDNKADFVSGGFVELYLKTMSNSKALTVPNTAILEEQGIYFVFVQAHPELFEKREVKIGVSDGLKTEIIKGVTSQERVVTEGAILVKLAQATGSLDAHSGHNH